MKSAKRIASAILIMSLVACSGPKPPPGWPPGEERPINGSPPNSLAPKAVK